MKKTGLLALICAGLLSACGNDINNATVGGLTVTIGGLPAGTTGNVAVTGPASFTKSLSATTTLERLTPGSYTITPAAINVGADRYSAASANATVVAGKTATSVVAYSKNPPSEVTLGFADFSGGKPDETVQGGRFVNYSYAGGGATSTIAANQPVKGAASLSTEYSLGAGAYGGVALGANANSSGMGNDENGNPKVLPLDLGSYKKLRIKLARSGGGPVSIKIVGNLKAVQDSGCYPVYQAAPGDDGGLVVTATLSEYTLDLSQFEYRSYCGAPDRKTISETLSNVVRVEIEDRFLPASGSANRTMTLGSVVFVK
jgi:hypothetical protein